MTFGWPTGSSRLSTNMVYKSEAQRKKFHADPRLRKYTKEWDAATGNRKLPKKVKKKPR